MGGRDTKTKRLVEQQQFEQESYVVTLTNEQTLENKTLVEPVIENFVNATHDHENNNDGGVLDGYVKDDDFTQDSGFLVGTGDGTYQEETDNTVRTSLGLGAGDSPEFITVDLSGLTDGNIPYMSASGFSDSPLSTDGTDLINTGDFTQKVYERHIQVQAIPSGTVANQATSNTVGTAVGLQFSSALDKYTGFQWEVPEDWVGGEDITIEIDWMPDSGAMSGTDTVQWILEYRAIAEGELVTQGTVATVTVTNDDDNAQYLTIHSPFTIDYDHADQPLTKQDHVFFLLHRNTGVANDFAGTVTATAFEVVYNSNKMPRSN